MAANNYWVTRISLCPCASLFYWTTSGSPTSYTPFLMVRGVSAFFCLSLPCSICWRSSAHVVVASRPVPFVSSAVLMHGMQTELALLVALQRTQSVPRSPPSGPIDSSTSHQTQSSYRALMQMRPGAAKHSGNQNTSATMSMLHVFFLAKRQHKWTF